MPVTYRDETRELHLHNGLVSLVLAVLENGWLGQLHLGAPLDPSASYRHLGPADFHGFSNRVGEPIGLVVPTPGSGDFLVPALVVEGPDGATVLDLAYEGHRVSAGKPALDGLPSTYVEEPGEATTLEIDLVDRIAHLRVVLSLTIFEGRAAISRSMRLVNDGEGRLIVRAAMSAAVDLADGPWDLLAFSGAWARERHPHRGPLLPGRRSVGSVRGATGHQQDPSLFLLRPGTDETRGEGLALSLVYSGNFLAEVEVGSRGGSRARIGLHPDGFAWTLEPGASFTTPEAIIAWSDAGIGGLSDTLHSLYRERLARGAWRDRSRPVLLNSWEGVYFDFDHERLVEMARATADLGVELFVLDDGWFGRRDSDDSSLGDWTVDRRKLPNGLGPLAAEVEALGLSFGLWIEPEMVSPRSRLFEAHPEWAIGVPGRPRTESRQQLVLDLSRPEVVDHLEAAIADVLSSAAIRYVKWDMNRNITEPYGASLRADRQGEFFHRYMLGTYELWRRLTTRFPEILFESCAGGGGRFDPGMLAFAPQAWTSDDTDAVERLAIQWGASHVYPLSSMAAHVSAIPNHQVGRVTPLGTRAAVAFFGVFGYELDPRTLSEAERAEIKAQVAFYKDHRELFQRGRFLRLRSPIGQDDAAWMVVAPDRRTAIVAHVRVLERPVPPSDRLRLRGLDAGATYRIEPWPGPGNGVAGSGEAGGTAAGGDRTGVARRGGDLLMAVGLGLEPADPPTATPRGDFTARIWVLTTD
ncbi:MAG TPA: alpha-galactosidase [Candidatus Sulfomarinibacteraceae bacterium]|nr:alpha-galactosidase [Candidatus Sulfomarinibacteraceae bacterium]